MKETPEYMNDVVKKVQKELVEIDLNNLERGEKLVKISKRFLKEERRKLIALLRECKDIFAWSYQEMPSLSPNLVTHEGKSGFVSHTKLTAEATFMDLFHYD